MRILKNPCLNIVLYEPQIPQNTGNIARLCAATKCHLILLGELGFDLGDKYLKRAGLDYWKFVSWEHIPNSEDFFVSLDRESFSFLSVYNKIPYTKIFPQSGDFLFFGKETTGLPKKWMESFPNRCFTIPMWEKGVRSLNLSVACGIAIYEAHKQINS